MSDPYILLRDLAENGKVQATDSLLSLLGEFNLAYVSEGESVQLRQDLELLEPELLNSFISDSAKQCLSTLDLHWTLDSTNTFLMERSADSNFHGYVCLAEQQTAGKGRRGRPWVSPFGKNIYVTLGWSIDAHTPIAGLSLAVGTCVARAIRSVTDISVQLKWPNDILLDDGKAAGILVELAGGNQQSKQVVVGVGINLALSNEDSLQIDQPWSVIGGASRNRLAAELINELSAGLTRFVEAGFVSFQEEWLALDAHANQQVRILSHDRTIEGTSRGVDHQGNLILDTEQGRQTINAGEVSLRSIG